MPIGAIGLQGSRVTLLPVGKVTKNEGGTGHKHQTGDIVKVKFQLAQPLDIGNDGVELTLHHPSGALVGKLTIGKATVKWKKRNARSESEIKTERLVELIEQDIMSNSKRKPARQK